MSSNYKVGKALKGGGGVRAYQDLVLGTRSLGFLLKFELIMLAAQNLPGALGLWLRKKLYPCLLGACGKGCLFGKGVSFRHPGKISLGHGVVLDDGVLVDAKGEHNRGVSLGDGVFVGRNSLVYTKGGEIELAAGVNVSANCELYASNRLVVGEGCFIAAYSYLLSGGEYEIGSTVPLSQQAGDFTRGPTVVGKNVWIAAHVVVADGSVIGDHAVVAAGAVVRGEIPARTLAGGVPARVIKELKPA